MDAKEEKLDAQKVKKPRKVPKSPERKSRPEEWYSEHDYSLGDGFQLVYSKDNRPMGFRVDGGFYA